MTRPDLQPDATTPAPPAVRFVTLEHLTGQESHFDLMIDAGVTLATWQFVRPPDETPREGQRCRRLPDHRRIYLDYEGPISGDRGTVRRRDWGTCRTYQADDSTWEVEFAGERLRGRCRLQRTAEAAGAWWFGPWP